MNQSMEEYQEKYRQHFRGVRPIFEKHFPSADEKEILGLVHLFIAEKEVGLYENWNYDAQQGYLTRLRSQLRQASETLSKIHPGILREVSANLTLPLVVLDGTYDRKTCANEVFDMEPSPSESQAAFQVLQGLELFSEEIDKAIKYTQGELPVGIPVGNRNIDAWRIVEAAVEVSRRRPDEMNVPKKMNGSGPLRRLLLDLFEHYNINANVDAAFNGWGKHIEKS